MTDDVKDTHGAERADANETSEATNILTLPPTILEESKHIFFD